MAKGWCLIKQHADEFRNKLKSGEINPQKMFEMDSVKRREFFEGFMDKDAARKTNLLFEKKVVLKNREKGMIRWAEALTGVTSKQREALKETIRKNMEERSRKTFSPEEDEMFLEDLVNERLGIGVSRDEAKTIFELSQKVEEGKQLLSKDTIYDKLKEIKGKISEGDKSTIDNILDKLSIEAERKTLTRTAVRNIKRYLAGENPSDEVRKQVDELVDKVVNKQKNNVEYGAAKVALDEYVGNIKLGIKEPYDLSMKTVGRIISDVAGFSKSVIGSIDNSFIGRQGIKTLYTHPKIWLNGVGSSFKTLAKAGINGEDAVRGIKAEIFGRENSMNGLYEKMKLDIGIMEEAFPTTLPEKAWLFGRVFKASNQAFTGTAYRMRADLADLLIEKAKNAGVDLEDKFQAESLGTLINSMTGRGKKGIGKLGAKTNVLLFSPKFLQSNIDTLGGHLFDPSLSAFAKKEAALNILKIAGSIGSILYLADKLQPGSVEWDPRSSDFGKIKIGNTRFDITGGMASLVTLASRMLGGIKSTTTGAITKATDFGGKDASEIVANFVENKTSPIAKTILNFMKGEDFDRNPMTLKAIKENPLEVGMLVGKGLFVPLPLQNAKEAYKNKDSEPWLAAIILDALGIGANIYKYSDQWKAKETKEMEQFKEEVGEDKFKEANDKFNTKVNEKLLDIKKKKEFMDLSDDDKDKVVSKVKDKMKEEVFKEYKFKYVQKKGEENKTVTNLIK